MRQLQGLAGNQILINKNILKVKIFNQNKSVMEKSLSRMMSLLTLGTGLAACSTVDQESQTQTDPNIVLIFLDDSGWADFQPFA